MKNISHQISIFDCEFYFYSILGLFFRHVTCTTMSKNSTGVTMKKKILLFGLLIALVLSACKHDDYYYVDTTPPAPPENVQTVVRDNRVDILWEHNRETDLAGYNVYYAWGYYDEYKLLGSTESDFYVDEGAVNGDLYYYAVVAYDFDGNESELSYDVAYGAPRPEGMNQSVFDFWRFPNTGGYDFSSYSVVPYNSTDTDYSADFFFENYDGTFYLNVWEDSEIQDMGPTESIYDIPYAPVSGWEPIIPGDNVKYVEARVGYTYVCLTWDNHFAKIRIKTITSERMIFDWTYQTIEGEQQLKPKPKNMKRTKKTEVKKNSLYQ